MPYEFNVGDLVVPKPNELEHIKNLVARYARITYKQGIPLVVVGISDESFGGSVLEVKYEGKTLPKKWASRFVKVGPDYVPPSKEELLIKKIQQLYNRQKYVVEGVTK